MDSRIDGERYRVSIRVEKGKRYRYCNAVWGGDEIGWIKKVDGEVIKWRHNPKNQIKRPRKERLTGLAIEVLSLDASRPLGPQLGEARKNIGLTQTQITRRMIALGSKSDAAHVHKVENTVFEPLPEFIAYYAKALNIKRVVITRIIELD